MNARFSVGIDLGTSNSAIAVGDIESGDTKIFEIDQIVGPNQVGELPTLPSAIYVPHREEFPEGSFPLPWNGAGEAAIVGQFARDRGALVPDRLVASAKSWLPTRISTRNSRSCPGGPTSRKRNSHPSNARAVICSISRGVALRRACAGDGIWDLSEGQIVVTVPASFDEVARSLTAEAAKAAGLGDVTLLEEPQAAFYAWTAQTGRTWRNSGFSRRYRPGLRRRRRDSRFQPDRCNRCRGQPGT